MTEFNHEQSIKVQPDRAAKELARHTKEAGHLANYAIRVANDGKLDSWVRPKTTRRFIPDIAAVHDSAIYHIANDLLAEHGLQLEQDSVSFADPVDLIKVQLLPEQPTAPTTEIK